MFRRLLATFLAVSLLWPPSAFAEGDEVETDTLFRGAMGLALPAQGSAEVGTVQPDGSLRFHYPIALPPAPGRVRPEVVISYSSFSRADSWVGYGWSLTLGSIQRSLKQGVPSYSEADTFLLDGQELVEDSGQPGQYHTRHETFARIRRVTWDANADAWVLNPQGDVWEVRTKNGTARLYGVDANSRIEKPGAGTFSWLLSQVVDVYGNGAAVQYDRRDPGQPYPETLRYGLRRNGATLESLDPSDPDSVDRVVRFVLEATERPDPSVRYSARLEQLLAHRLSRIDVSVGGELTRRYVMDYGEPSADSFRSLLREIGEYGADADEPTPTDPQVTIFDYRSNVEDGTVGWEEAAGAPWHVPNYWFCKLWGEEDYGDGGTRIADMNGDALPDLVFDQVYEGQHIGGIHLNNGQGFGGGSGMELPRQPYVPENEFTLYAWTENLPDVPGTQWFANSRGRILTDVDGDGRADLLAAHSHYSDLDDYEGKNRFRYYRNDPSANGGWSLEVDETTSFSYYYDPLVFDFASSETWTDPIPPPWSYTLSAFQGNSSLADLNGDGRPDLTARVSDSWPSLSPPARRFYTLAESDGSGFGAVQSDRFLICEDEVPGEPGRLTDACRRESVDMQTTVYPPFRPYTIVRFGKRHIDLNADGLSDYVQAFDDTTSGPSGSKTWRAFLNDGDDYVAANSWVVPADIIFDYQHWTTYQELIPMSREMGVRTVDVNGDGRLDLVRARAEEANQTWLNTGYPSGPAASPWRLAEGATAAWTLPDELDVVKDEDEGTYDSDGYFIIAKDLGVRFADLNGDGMVDIIVARWKDDTRKTYLNKGKVPDLLEKIASPLGGTTSYAYTPSTQLDNPELPRVLQLVTSVKTDDGRGTVGTTTYDYSGGIYSAPDREFRGFETIESTSPVGTVTTTEYHNQTAALMGLPHSREVRDSQEALWWREEFEYEGDTEPPYRRLVSIVRWYRYDGHGSVPQEGQTDFSYDTYGNLERKVVHGDAAIPNTPDRISETVYTQPNLEAYIVDRPAYQRSIDPADGTTILDETQYYYDDEEADPTAQPTLGDLTKRVRWLGDAPEPDPVERFDYNEYGNVSSYINPRGYWTTSAYDAVFHTFPVDVTDALGHASQVEYSPVGFSCPISHPAGAGLAHGLVDANGQRTRSCYDAFGRPTLEELPSGLGRTEISYTDTPGQVSVETKAWLGGTSYRSSTAYLDGLGRSYRTVADGPRGIPIESWVYFDAAGRVKRETLPSFLGEQRLENRYEYDPLNRVVELEKPGNRVVQTTYDRGTKIVIDPNGNRTDSTFDTFGDLRIVGEYAEGPGQPVVETGYDYDHKGRLRFVRAPAPDAGEPTVPDLEIRYDRLGRQSEFHDPDLGLSTYSYDANGNLRSAVDASGITTTYEYDPVDRLQSSVTDGADGLAVSLTYDEPAVSPYPIGRLTTATDPVGIHRFSHDAVGRVTGEERVLDGYSFSFAQTYDLLGQPVLRTYPSGASGPVAQVENQYDAAGYLSAVKELVEGVSVVQSIRYDPQLRIEQLTTADGVTLEQTYSATSNLLDGISLRAGTRVLERLRYQFDPGGRVETIADELDAGFDRGFLYDGVDRLTDATGPYGPSFGPLALAFRYDKYGNLTEKGGVTRSYGRSTTGLCDNARSTPHAVTAVGGDALTYDCAGNLTTYGTRSYGWNSRNRLAEVREGGELQASYGYDFTGTRVKSVEGDTTRYFVTPDFEWDGSLATVHIFAGSERVASRSVALPASQLLASHDWPDDRLFALVPTLTVLALGPPLGLLLLMGCAIRRRGWALPRPLEAFAAATLIFYWVGLTSPAAAAVFDTDGDGLRDVEELYAYGTDPSLPDTDGDGFRDGQEVAGWSDPLSSSSFPLLPLMAPVAAGQVASGATTSGFGSASGDGGEGLSQGSGADPLELSLGYEAARAAATLDQDGDGIGAAWDLDDGDPLVTETKIGDFDRDGIPDYCDADRDGDGVLNGDDSDSDNDRLTDALELSLGTDPYRPDSDGDGLRDGAEVALGTNPLSADTDGDGVPDADDVAPSDPNVELAAGSLPTGDIDDDGLVDSVDALLSMRIAAELRSVLPEEIARGDVAPRGQMDGELSSADALLILNAASDKDVDGDGLSPAAEAAAGANAFLADSDGDGLADNDEVSPPGGGPATNPASRDSDGDGLLDIEEITVGAAPPSDPTNPDTDEDGLPDGRDPQPATKYVFYHGDHLQSTTVLTNIAGEVLARVLYKPFGKPLVRAGEVPEFAFTGQRYNEDLGLYDYGARDYDPVLARFLQPDSVIPGYSNPQALNRYNYVLNGPTHAVDPSGSIPIYDLDWGSGGETGSDSFDITSSGGYAYSSVGGSVTSYSSDLFGLGSYDPWSSVMESSFPISAFSIDSSLPSMGDFSFGWDDWGSVASGDGSAFENVALSRLPPFSDPYLATVNRAIDQAISARRGANRRDDAFVSLGENISIGVPILEIKKDTYETRVGNPAWVNSWDPAKGTFETGSQPRNLRGVVVAIPPKQPDSYITKTNRMYFSERSDISGVPYFVVGGSDNPRSVYLFQGYSVIRYQRWRNP